MRLTSRIQAQVGILLTATMLAAGGNGRAAGLMSGAPRALPRQTGTVRQPASTAETDALRELQKRLDGYLHLRSDLAHKLKPLSPTADAAELTARQESLASAIRIARKDAQKGDLIPSAAASRIRTIVAEDLKSRPPEARRAAFSEVPEGVVVAVNKTYPAQAALPTVPPLLLNKLPTLPDNLQYRFVGRDVVLLDADTQLIVDYIENVLPPH